MEFKESIGFEFIELAEISENVLGVKVDLLSKRTVKPEMRFLEEAGRKIAIQQMRLSPVGKVLNPTV